MPERLDRPHHVARLTALLRQFPVVAVLGARQVGKTTLARQVVAARRGPTALFDTPEWAPDGSGVLCVPRLTELALVSPAGRVIRRRGLAATGGVTKAPTAPRYSRDGRTIYVAGTREDCRRGIWAIPAAGGTPRLVIAFDDA